MSTSDILERDIRFLKGVGEKRALLFKKLGIDSIGALLRFFPRGYIDLTAPYSVASAPTDTPCAVKVTVTGRTPVTRVSGGKTLCRVYSCDDSGDLTIVFFNNKYAPAALKEDHEYILYGKIQGNILRKEIINPIIVPGSGSGELIPRYSLTEGLSSRTIENAVRSALELVDQIEEILPENIIEKYGLISRDRAMRLIHFPHSNEEVAIAKKRLVFDELVMLRMGMQIIRGRDRKKTDISIVSDNMEAFIASLPFRPTNAQLRCMKEIASDLASSYPMSRLLQGDVGSGKTAVAAAGIFCAVQSGYQCAVMAPTEILAEQHADTFNKFLAPFGISVGLLTGSTKEKARRNLLERLASGETDLIIGTHALISENVKFNNLGLVVADEQHRFGVRQRAALSAKGRSPHFLVMSATPIPRTLALIMYGDLDISVIDEMPPGREPVNTRLVTSEYRSRYLNYVRKIVKEGHAAYIVCPLVDESENLDSTVSAVEYFEDIKTNYLPDLNVGLVHGKLKPAEKKTVMDAFRDGGIDVLISTTVIEVGVDVPRANLMIIENAERFGLSTLHQLRGRIGRGGGESWCILVSSTNSETSINRLKVMTSTTDGFEIARQDLAQRGPGDFLGNRQHGLPEVRISDLYNNDEILYLASDAAELITQKDPMLTLPEHLLLRREIETVFSNTETTFN